MSFIFTKKNIYPLILPQHFYVDRFQTPNAYIEMNPSMNIDTDGNVKILVRCVNYRKFYTKPVTMYTMYQYFSNSIYYVLDGKIEDDIVLDIDSFSINHIEYNYDLPVFITCWKGLEDIRFIDSTTILAIIPECNKNGNPSIFQAKIEKNSIHSFKECYPNHIEKNWMPYINTDGTPYVIYSLSPFKIKQVETEEFKEINISVENAEMLKGYNGSTNGISYKKNFYLFLIHTNKERVYQRWLLFDIVTYDVQLSQPFTFFKHSYIEFPISLCEFQTRLFISLGVNDDKAFVIETDFTEIEKFFINEKN
jgi:hypothetical protein